VCTVAYYGCNGEDYVEAYPEVELKGPFMPDGNIVICDRLRTLREEKKLSQGGIEKRTGLPRCYISRVENGHTVPSVETLEKVARALGVPRRLAGSWMLHRILPVLGRPSSDAEPILKPGSVREFDRPRHLSFHHPVPAALKFARHSFQQNSLADDRSTRKT